MEHRGHDDKEEGIERQRQQEDWREIVTRGEWALRVREAACVLGISITWFLLEQNQVVFPTPQNVDGQNHLSLPILNWK